MLTIQCYLGIKTSNTNCNREADEILYVDRDILFAVWLPSNGPKTSCTMSFFCEDLTNPLSVRRVKVVTRESISRRTYNTSEYSYEYSQANSFTDISCDRWSASKQEINAILFYLFRISNNNLFSTDFTTIPIPYPQSPGYFGIGLPEVSSYPDSLEIHSGKCSIGSVQDAFTASKIANTNLYYKNNTYFRFCTGFIDCPPGFFWDHALCTCLPNPEGVPDIDIPNIDLPPFSPISNNPYPTDPQISVPDGLKVVKFRLPYGLCFNIEYYGPNLYNSTAPQVNHFGLDSEYYTTRMNLYPDAYPDSDYQDISFLLSAMLGITNRYPLFDYLFEFNIATGYPFVARPLRNSIEFIAIIPFEGRFETRVAPCDNSNDGEYCNYAVNFYVVASITATNQSGDSITAGTKVKVYSITFTARRNDYLEVIYSIMNFIVTMAQNMLLDRFMKQPIKDGNVISAKPNIHIEFDYQTLNCWS